MLRTTLLISALSVAAPAAVLGASEPASLSAAQVVAKNVSARGGLAAWHAVQTMSWTGKLGAGATTYAAVTSGGHLQEKQREEPQLPFELDFKRPQKSRLEIQFNGQTAVQLFDGANGWKYRPFLGRSQWESYTPEELQLAAAEPGIDGYLIDYAERGARIESAGREMLEGRSAYKLKVTLRSGAVRHVWVDARSFLDVQIEGTPRRLDGRVRSVLIRLRDFRPEHGLLIPHTLETVVQGIPRSETISIERVAVNPALDDSRFSHS